MKKLGKKMRTTTDTIATYSCTYACGCDCPGQFVYSFEESYDVHFTYEPIVDTVSGV